MDAAGYRPHTRVSGGPVDLVVLWGGFPLLGAGAGWLVATATSWLAGLPWVPFSNLIEWLDGLPEPQATAGTIAVGVLAGLVVAGIGTAERLVVTVDATQVRLRREGKDQNVDRIPTRVVFVDHGHLVLLDSDGAELAREKSDLPAAELAAAFARTAGPGRTRTRTDPRTGSGCPTFPGCRPGRTPCCGSASGRSGGTAARTPGSYAESWAGSGWCCATRANGSTGG
ncbi:hypothetical protein GCM10027614_62420 [Micromonospora vulcania]